VRAPIWSIRFGAWITQQPARPLVEPHGPASAWRRFVRSIERILPVAALL
jgi:hypothetical protein